LGGGAGFLVLGAGRPGVGVRAIVRPGPGSTVPAVGVDSVPAGAPGCREVSLGCEFWLEVGPVTEVLGALVVISTGSRVFTGLPWPHPNVKPMVDTDATIMIVLLMIFLRLRGRKLFPTARSVRNTYLPDIRREIKEILS
jgi:hypothetical protein